MCRRFDEEDTAHLNVIRKHREEVTSLLQRLTSTLPAVATHTATAAAAAAAAGSGSNAFGRSSSKVSTSSASATLLNDCVPAYKEWRFELSDSLRHLHEAAQILSTKAQELLATLAAGQQVTENVFVAAQEASFRRQTPNSALQWRAANVSSRS